jgi:hypothetical protein
MCNLKHHEEIIFKRRVEWNSILRDNN